MTESVLPQFKYHPNLYEMDILEHFEGTCKCCGNPGSVFYQGIYCVEDVDYLCLDCIASGKAAEKFDGHFNSDFDDVDNPEAIDELMHRTPGYLSWQEPVWKACCNDFCAYLGTVGTKELEKLGIADELFEEGGSFDGYENARSELAKDGWFTGHLFQCLHCGKYLLHVEAN